MSKSKNMPIIVPRSRPKPTVNSDLVHDDRSNTKEEQIAIETIKLIPSTAEEINRRRALYPIISLVSKKANANSKNLMIAEVLSRLVEHIENQIRASDSAQERKKHGFRLIQIKKGVDIIASYEDEIVSGSWMAKNVDGIGKGIGERIDTILQTGNLPELEETVGQGDEMNGRIAELTTVKGIGIAKARELIAKYEDLTGVEDLIDRWRRGTIKVRKHELTHQIEIGLRYYDDFKEKIPRTEIDVFFTTFKNICAKIDPKLRYEICGSYRRLKSQSNDVDVLLSHPNLLTEEDVAQHPINYLSAFVLQLIEIGLIVDSVSDPQKSTTKYMGVIRVSNNGISNNCTTRSIHRHIDIKFVPYHSWAAATLHLTGSGGFNKMMRTIALQRGLSISEYGIYKVDGDEQEVIPTFSEEQIFQLVGIEYLEPKDREV